MVNGEFHRTPHFLRAMMQTQWSFSLSLNNYFIPSLPNHFHINIYISFKSPALYIVNKTGYFGQTA